MNRHWALKLSDICEIVSGATPKTSVKEYWDGDIRWATPADLSDLEEAYLDDTPRKITSAGLASCSAQILPANSVLLSSRAPIGHVAINAVPMATNQGFKSLVPKDGLADAKFLYHWLKYNKAQIQALGNGATFKEVSKAIVSEISIDLPSLDEQRRIAAILDKAETLRQKRKSAIALLGGLERAIFLDMFGDPLTNPRSWARKPIKDVCEVVTGNTPPRADVENYGSEIEWIKSDNINSGQLYVSAATESLSLKGKEQARVAPAGSTLVTCIAGSPNSIGNAAMTDRLVAFNQQINALIPRKVDPMFIYAQIRVGKRLIQNASTGGMKGLVSKSRLQSVEVMLPPIEQQREFSLKLRVTAALKSKANVQLHEIETRLISLQHRAFSGQL